MNKIIKGCCIGGLLYGTLEIGYALGKIRVLRTWAKCEREDIRQSDVIKELKEDDRLRANFIGYMSEVEESQ